jgi:hypothetical protein
MERDGNVPGGGSDAAATGEAAGDERGDPPCCKVGRSARAYGIRGLDEALERRHDGGESLRDLATFVNRRLLERAIAAADVDTVSDAGTIYDLLATDEVGAGRRTEIREKLARAGVDLDAVESRYVSHQTVRDHLRDCLGVDTSVRADVDRESARGTIEWARARFLGIVERTLERLAAAGALDAGELEVTGTVRVTCTDCGETYRLGVLVERGRCGCSSDGDG